MPTSMRMFPTSPWPMRLTATNLSKIKIKSNSKGKIKSKIKSKYNTYLAALPPGRLRALKAQVSAMFK